MAEISLRHVSKIYPGGVTAVRDFDLDIADKEFVVFVGPSGCGKSTTLRMIAGLEEETQGTISIGDRVVTGVPPRDRDIAMVFQSYALYRHMTVYKNMAFALKLRGEPRDQIDAKVRQVAETLGISHLLDRKPGALSGGESQRVALGRAMVRDPAVFLLDEPLSNLDAKLRSAMRAEIIKLHRDLETTFVYVTHDQTEAMTMGDRIVIMDKGVIQQTATPREIYDHPHNLFVAGFVGTPQMNFFPSVLRRDENGWFLVVCGARIDLQRAPVPVHELQARENQPLTLGIRPEHLTLASHFAAGQTFPGATVELCENLGSDSNVHLSFEDTRVVVRAAARIQAPIGAKINIVLNPEYAHLFDSETGLNICEDRGEAGA